MSNSEATTTRRLPAFAAGLGCGCAGGILVTIAVVALAGWAWVTVEEQLASDPLSDLQVPSGPLTTQQTKVIVDQLANQYLEDAYNVGLVVALVRDDDASLVYGYGLTMRSGGKQPDGETLFEIAS